MPLQSYNHIFFDIDGVLVSSTDYYAKIFQSIAHDLGADPSIPYSYYVNAIGIRIEESLGIVIPQENHDKIRPLWQQLNKDKVDPSHFPLVEGAHELLISLKKQNKKVALVSSKSRQGVNMLIEHFQWQDIVDFSIGGDEVVAFKPHPEGLERALDYFGARKNDVLFIGDSVHDLGAARNANVPFLGVLTGICTEDDWKRENVAYKQSVKELL